VPLIDMPERLDAWLARQTPQADVVQGVLSLHASTQPLHVLRAQAAEQTKTWALLNGPEGGLTDAEDAAARAKGFVALTLGDRVLRAETAALGALALLTLT
jgi:16S rRNA (uracil1498-N3)-methyltransferase